MVKDNASKNVNYLRTYFHYFKIEYEFDEESKYKLRFLKRNHISGGRSRLQMCDINGNHFDFTDQDVVEILCHERNKGVSEILKGYLLDISSKNYEDSVDFKFQLIDENGSSESFCNNLVSQSILNELENEMVFLPISHTIVEAVSFYLFISMIIYKEQCTEDNVKYFHRKTNQAFIYYYLTENGIDSIEALSEMNDVDPQKNIFKKFLNL